MNHVILTTAAAITLLTATIPAAQAAARPDAGAITSAGTVQSGHATKLAMGPTSAAHLPGGPVNQQSGGSSKCSGSTVCNSTSCNHAKYRHKPAAQN